MQTCKEALRYGLNEFIFRTRAEEHLLAVGGDHVFAVHYHPVEAAAAPPPQVTMSLNAGLLTAPTTSLPSPAESLSVENSRSGPSITRSLPSSPNMLSEPRPPITKSLPGPPSRFLSPPEKPRSLPPRTISLPGPPSTLSLPARAKSMSLPPLPKRLSAPLVGSPQSVGTISTDLVDRQSNPACQNQG